MFNTQLVITWPANNTGLPPDANPAWTAIQNLINTKTSEMRSANLLADISANSGITTMNFVNSNSAIEYQNFLTGVQSDFNLAVPSFEIIENS